MPSKNNASMNRVTSLHGTVYTPNTRDSYTPRHSHPTNAQMGHSKGPPTNTVPSYAVVRSCGLHPCKMRNHHRKPPIGGITPKDVGRLTTTTPQHYYAPDLPIAHLTIKSSILEHRIPGQWARAIGEAVILACGSLLATPHHSGRLGKCCARFYCPNGRVGKSWFRFGEPKSRDFGRR
jgi:hypothetical protein